MAELHFNNADAISAAVLGGLGGYILIESRQWAYMGPDGPGPAFFPTWYGIALIALSLVVVGARLYRSLTQQPIESAQRAAQAAPPERARGRREVAHALAVWAAFAACIALLKLLGFMLAFGLFTYLIVSAMYHQRWSVALAVAVASAIGFYLVFTLALGVALPPGLLGL